MLFYFAWKYSASNTQANYMPDWDSNRKLEAIWWSIPLLLIIILAVITWRTSYALDPFRPLESDKKPVRIQVVALEWKWLFIYPELQIATVNYLQFPEGTPVNFEVTADAPMNSFWIPKLGGQIYAMSGMTTKLHLMADNQGIYEGSSANLSGDGFSGMKFVAESTSQAAFDDWVKANRSAEILDSTKYKELAEPSKDNPVRSFMLADTKIYDNVINKYMVPGEGDHGAAGTQHEGTH
jgi:cytochrome o ubiquinol oxidase subunit 2